MGLVAVIVFVGKLTNFGPEDKFDVSLLALRVDELEGVDAEAVHGAPVLRDALVIGFKMQNSGS